MVHDAADAWHQLSTPPGDNVAAIDLGIDRFPAVYRDEGIEIDEIALFVDPSDPLPGGTTVEAELALPDGSTSTISLGPSPTIDGVLEGSATGFVVEPGTFELSITDVPAPLANDDDRLDPEKIDDLVIVLRYRIDE